MIGRADAKIFRASGAISITCTKFSLRRAEKASVFFFSSYILVGNTGTSLCLPHLRKFPEGAHAKGASKLKLQYIISFQEGAKVYFLGFNGQNKSISQIYWSKKKISLAKTRQLPPFCRRP